LSNPFDILTQIEPSKMI